MGNIKLLVMDVDGTLTDGKIYIGAAGEAVKAFSVKDGYGIGQILPVAGIQPAIITGRKSAIVEARCRELKITHLYQGIADKSLCLRELSEKMGISLDQIACVGDDLNDLPMMELCKVKGCPADAAAEVKSCCEYVCSACGGDGAVREFIEWLVKK